MSQTKAGGQPSKPNEGQAPGGEPERIEEMMEMDEELMMRYEEEMYEDMKRSALYSLLLVNYDYFDHQVMGRAQAEFRFLRGLEKEYKSQKKEDIPVPKYNFDQFKGMSPNRPMYAVILTILENARKTEHAEAAAGEYMRFRTLEKKMNKKIPKDIEVDVGPKSENYRNIVQRYKCPSSRSFRQAGEFKMVLLDEYKRLQETIAHQRNQISELSSRLSGITNQQIADGEIFTDIGDRNTPRMLGRRFGDVFEDGWTQAYDVLKPKRPDPKDDEKEEYDEATIVILQHAVRAIYKYCQDTAESQVTKLITSMMPPILNPMNVADKSGKPSDDSYAHTEKMARDFRKAMAPATVPVIQQDVLNNVIRGKILPAEMGKELKEFVDNLVNIIWYMCIQQPPMVVIWGEPGQKFNKDQFRISGKKGNKYRLTIWPAVLYHLEGPLASPGYAVPE